MDVSAPYDEDLGKLRAQISQAGLPEDLEQKLIVQLNRLEKVMASSSFQPEFGREIKYLQFVSSLPFNKSSEDILDLKRVEEILNRNHYGLKIVKERITEYLATLVLNSRQGSKMHAPILAFIGLVGSGKTSLAYSLAESLGRQIIRIPFGGLGSVKELRGESRVRVEAEPGRIIQAIHALGVNNPVILLDEIDRVAENTRGEVMGVLVELLDPEQNSNFLDHYVDHSFDLSNVLFIATANNTTSIATAVLDRLEIIEMPAYSDEEKIVISKDYLLPKILQEAGMSSVKVVIDEAVWQHLVRPLGFDAGIRSLKRTIEGIVRRIAKEVVTEGNKGPYRLTEENIRQYIKA